jgi:hypothetical protein
MHGYQHAIDLLGRLVRECGRPSLNGIFAAFLAAVFISSGLAKLRRPAVAALSIVNFGVTSRVWTAAGVALGASEVALSVVLLVPPLRVPATWAAAVVLIGFAVLISRSLRRGDRFSCACFGRDTDDISRKTLARTAGLSVVALVAASGATVNLPSMTLGWWLWTCALIAGSGAWAVLALVSAARDLAEMSRTSNRLLLEHAS